MKQRLDVLMVTRGLAPTRTQAQALIMAGQVSAEGRRLEKPGLMVHADTSLHVKDQPRYASRAGDKLASVVEHFGLDFGGKIVLDVGSSTGGFTDLALQHGAARVYCVDVGTGQLAYRLRQDERVVVMEQTDIRDVTVGDAGKAIPEPADMAVMDVSFISLTKVLEVAAALVRPGGLLVAMAKPQFEAGKALADKYHGVIPLGGERDEVLGDLRLWMRERFEIMAEMDSAVSGAEGNVERFFLLRTRS
ncbi:MAG TPA: TlyA family RNA methyltransferase [Candidatus Saccharimonadia bacterium]|nr:TlyA family RNA methyltransferase [Candidatus Saccharimonadia bacterium]